MRGLVGAVIGRPACAGWWEQSMVGLHVYISEYFELAKTSLVFVRVKHVRNNFKKATSKVQYV